jgi:hypothetical protein
VATIERYEDIQGWQKARELAKVVYDVSKQDAFARDFGLKDQIRRAAVSVTPNIAEGLETSGHNGFARFLPLPRHRPVRCNLCHTLRSINDMSHGNNSIAHTSYVTRPCASSAVSSCI